MIAGILAFALGFLTAQIFSGYREHKRGVFRSFVFHLKGYKVHMHHWILSLATITFIFTINAASGTRMDSIESALVFFFLGVFIQGIRYKDWKDIIRNS